MSYGYKIVTAQEALPQTHEYLADLPFARFIRYHPGKEIESITIEEKAQALHWDDRDKFCKTLYRRGKLSGSSDLSPVYGFLVSDSRKVREGIEKSILYDGRSIKRWRPVDELPLGMTPGTCGPFLAQRGGRFPDLDRIGKLIVDIDVDHQYRMTEFAVPGRPAYGILVPFNVAYGFLQERYGDKLVMPMQERRMPVEPLVAVN